MTIGIGPLGAGDERPVADFVARLQRDPAHHVVLAGTEPDVVAADLAEVASWRDRLLVARDGDTVVGVLLADLDEERRRVWWWGPWAVDEDVAVALHAAADGLVGELFDTEEYAFDARNERGARLAEARGAHAETASAILSLDPLVVPAASGTTRPATPSDGAAVAPLHDQVFGDTHTTGEQLVRAARTVVRVAEAAGRVVGYVAVEQHADGSGYVDYLGVAPDHRATGLGRALVGDALRDLADRGLERAHLTVRVDNEAARRLYGSLGFVEERIAVPWRRGFSLS